MEATGAKMDMREADVGLSGEGNGCGGPYGERRIG